MQSITFEQFSMAIEANPGTPEAAPTHVMNLKGIIKPQKEMYTPPHGFGTNAERYQSITTRKWGDVSADGPLDTALFPFLMNKFVQGGVTTPTQPPSAVLTQDWEFIFSLITDNLERSTAWWGDQNLQVWQSSNTHFNEMKITNDASGTEAAAITLTGLAAAAAAVAAPTLPAVNLGQLLPAPLMELWIDTGTDPIGTTPVTGRLVKAEHTISTGLVPKYYASGPTGNLSFPAVGMNRATHLMTVLTLELPDLTQYNQWENDDFLKCRVRHNGALIESVTPDYYYGVEFDTYGPFNGLDFGENADGANRTIVLTIDGHYDATLASDCRVLVRNSNATL